MSLAEGCSALASPATIASTAAAFTLMLAAGATAVSSGLPSDSTLCSTHMHLYHPKLHDVCHLPQALIISGMLQPKGSRLRTEN